MRSSSNDYGCTSFGTYLSMVRYSESHREGYCAQVLEDINRNLSFSLYNWNGGWFHNSISRNFRAKSFLHSFRSFQCNTISMAYSFNFGNCYQFLAAIFISTILDYTMRSLFFFFQVQFQTNRLNYRGLRSSSFIRVFEIFHLYSVWHHTCKHEY